MSKQSKRPGRAARDVHAAIAEQAAELRSAGRFGVRDADELPETAALLDAARDAVAAGVPRFVRHAGRNYWLRVRLVGLEIDLFAAPGDAEPLVRGASMSLDPHGHRPGH
jgi:hypothetical protein